MKILIAADGSPYSKRVLAYLAAHDEWLGPSHRYTVLHVVAPVPRRAAAAIDRAVLKAHYQEQADQVFKPMRTFFKRQGIEAGFVHKVGLAGEAVAEAANAGGCDLVIVGSHGHGVLANLLLGSVATKVIGLSRVPVLVVR